MSKIIVEIKDCSMYDVYKLINQIKRNKYVEDAYHVRDNLFGGLTPLAPDGSNEPQKCLCPSDGIYPGCPVHGSRRR